MCLFFDFYTPITPVIVSQISIFCYLNPPSKAGGIAVALFQTRTKQNCPYCLWCFCLIKFSMLSCNRSFGTNNVSVCCCIYMLLPTKMLLNFYLKSKIAETPFSFVPLHFFKSLPNRYFTKNFFIG